MEEGEEYNINELVCILRCVATRDAYSEMHVDASGWL